jgi:hypothetical protein
MYWSQLSLIDMVETRPQLTVVPSLFGGNPFDGGILKDRNGEPERG